MLHTLHKALKYVVVLVSAHIPYCNHPLPAGAAKETASIYIAPKLPLGDTARYVRLEIEMKKAIKPDFYFTDLPYDKNKGLMLMKDDASITDYTMVLKILSGGVVNGKTYPGFTYTDGTGKKIGYKYSFAINPNEGHTTDLENVTSWDQINQIIAKGHAFMNHSLFHGGTDKLKAIKDAEKNMWTHTHYRMTEIAVPSNDEGYVTSGLQLGYHLITSQFGEPVPDGNNDPGNQNISWGSFIPMTTQNFNKVLVSRYNLGDQWNSAELKVSENFIDEIFSGSNTGKKPIGAAFSHGPFKESKDAPDNFFAFLTYIQNHPGNHDSAWITSSKDLMNYEQTKAAVIVISKHYDAATKKFIIILDMKNVDPNVVSRNLSLKITGGTISTVHGQGSNDITFNPLTGLINIYKTDRSKVIDPYQDALPPQITSIVAKGKIILLLYDKPVTQSKIEGYDVPGNKVISLSGDGKTWQLHLLNTVQSPQTLFYRMQLGDAIQTGNHKMHVCNYAGQPIKF
ncbi:hypothetical protein [Pedobacter sp. L105]|uniref:hypothetical protein n=1 Tax=Pedobacter sp. L105 TaxID=1641871 RepID=UPI00131AF8DC|nr:hypothetical protein [Pedobacter sp. L105]